MGGVLWIWALMHIQNTNGPWSIEWAMLNGKGLKSVYKIRMGHALWKGGLMGIQNRNGLWSVKKGFNAYTKCEWAMVCGKRLKCE